MSGARRPFAVAFVVALLGFGLATGPANADTDPGSPSLTGVNVDGGSVTAVLTVPGAGTAGIDPGSLQVSFGGGTPVPAALAPIARERRAVLVVIDTSGSMAGGGLAAAKTAARTFLDAVPTDVEVGLASFADTARLLVAPTDDRAPVRAAIGQFRAIGDTRLYDALALGIRSLGDSGSRTVVLLSDGADTTSRTSLAEAESLVRSSGVRPVVVGFNTANSQNGVLTRIAKSGGGAFTTATDPASLEKAFGSAAREIAAQLRLVIPVPEGLSGQQELTVSGTVDGRAFEARATAVLSAGAAVQPGSDPVANPLIAPSTSKDGLVIAAAGAVSLGLLVLVLFLLSPRSGSVARKRVRALESYSAVGGVEKSAVSAPSLQGLSEGLTRAADNYISGRSSAVQTGLLLERADLPFQLNEWYVLRALALPISAAVFWTLFADSGARLLLTLIAVGLVGGLLPVLVLRYLAGKRARAFEVQLPDVLTLVASSLQTGFSLPQALDSLARDAADPAAKEFARALAETRIGVDLEDALDRTAERMASENLAWTTMAIRIQRRVGGNLADVMRTTAKTLRDRETLRRQVRALTAEGRLSAYILIALPLLMAGYLYIANRPYLSVLWHRSVGVVMLVVSAILLVIGVFWMRRIADVKV